MQGAEGVSVDLIGGELRHLVHREVAGDLDLRVIEHLVAHHLLQHGSGPRIVQQVTEHGPRGVDHRVGCDAFVLVPVLHLADGRVHAAPHRRLGTHVGSVRLGDQLDFGGSARAIEFVAPLRGNRSYAGLHRVRFEIEDDPSFDGNGGRLLMTYRPYVGDTATVDPVASNSVVVLDGFASARFDFGNVTTSATVDWKPEWVATQQLPALVRLQVDIEGQDNRVTIPDVIVAIRATKPNRLTRGRAR